MRILIFLEEANDGAASFDGRAAGVDGGCFSKTGGDQLVAWPAAIAGDKGYRANWINEMFLELSVTPVVSSKSDEDRITRPVACDRYLKILAPGV